MESEKLYKILSGHTGRVNSLAVGLREETISIDAAKKRAENSAKELIEDLNTD